MRPRGKGSARGVLGWMGDGTTEGERLGIFPGRLHDARRQGHLPAVLGENAKCAVCGGEGEEGGCEFCAAGSGVSRPLRLGPRSRPSSLSEPVSGGARSRPPSETVPIRVPYARGGETGATADADRDDWSWRQLAEWLDDEAIPRLLRELEGLREELDKARAQIERREKSHNKLAKELAKHIVWLSELNPPKVSYAVAVRTVGELIRNAEN
jgi:hypothetical protein